MSGLPRVIGHRVAAGSAPENTLAGFARAAQLGLTWVELDVQLSADGTPVVFHDDQLGRTTDGHGQLVEVPLEELRRLDAGRWFAPAFQGQRIPLLAEALAVISRLGLAVNIEIKTDEARGPATAAAALAVAAEVWPAGRPAPMISSFAESALAVAHRLAPDWPRGLLLGTWREDWCESTRRLECTTLNADHRHLDEVRVAAVKAARLGLLAYTVNQAERARRLWNWGVDGVFSDRPELLLPASLSFAGPPE
jgi:glycerophosphoryl diester phosphodiesterase